MAGEDWPQWRGPNRDGISHETGLLQSWPDGGPPLVFRADGLGDGYSTVSVAEGRIHTLGMLSGREWVITLDAETGAQLWATPHGEGYRDGRGDGPRSVPTVIGGRVYALGARGQLSALDAASGQIVWTLDLLREAGGRNISWGISESPLVLGDRVLVSPGGRSAGFAAFDRDTGELLWSAGGDEAGYASPLPVDLAGAPHIVYFSGERAAGIRADDGALLWSYRRASNRTANIATPILVSNRGGAAEVFLSSDYGTGGALLALRSDGAGGVTAEEKYFTRNMRVHHATPVLHDGVLYGFSGSIFSALDIETGALFWRDRSIRKGSLTFADNRLYVFSERGDVALVEPSRAGYEERGRFEFRRQDRSGENTWSHPVVANGLLYLRDQDVLLAYDVSAAPLSPVFHSASRRAGKGTPTSGQFSRWGPAPPAAGGRRRVPPRIWTAYGSGNAGVHTGTAARRAAKRASSASAMAFPVLALTNLHMRRPGLEALAGGCQPDRTRFPGGQADSGRRTEFDPVRQVHLDPNLRNGLGRRVDHGPGEGFGRGVETKLEADAAARLLSGHPLPRTESRTPPTPLRARPRNRVRHPSRALPPRRSPAAAPVQVRTRDSLAVPPHAPPTTPGRHALPKPRRHSHNRKDSRERAQPRPRHRTEPWMEPATRNHRFSSDR